MKNQYFGDVYDYIKYGLLRRLSCEGEVSTVLCWMLTHDDGGQDGRRNSYLEEHIKWRALDLPVFDCLIAAVDRDERDTRIIEISGLLPNTRFYARYLTDNPDERKAYFDEFFKFSRNRALVCFDPDNGLEVKSVEYGRQRSSKYLYMHEASQAFKKGHSLLIYQHMQRRVWDKFIEELANDLLNETRSEVVHVFRASSAAFLLVHQPDHQEQFTKAASQIKADWTNLLETRRYLKQPS